MTTRFYKSKPCTTKTKHDLASCGYAHNEYELIHPKCISYEECYNKKCAFMHADETIEEFRNRTNFVMPTFENENFANADPEQDDNLVEIILDDPSQSNDNNVYFCKSSIRRLILDKANPMSYYWATIGCWIERDIVWV